MFLERVNPLDFWSLDHKHLRTLVSSSSFEGSEAVRYSLAKKIDELGNEFSNLPSTISLEEAKLEWSRRYAPIKFEVYKAYGYTSKAQG